MSTRPAPESFVEILNEITFGDVWYCLKTIPSFLLSFITGFILVVIVFFMMTARLGKDCLKLEDEQKALESASGVEAGDEGGDNSGEEMRVEGWEQERLRGAA